MISQAEKFKARMVPIPEANDIPPLNCRKHGLLCPIITATAAATGAIPQEVPTFIKYFANKTGSAPFSASSSITVKNHFFPRTHFTLVAPVEPETIVLIS